MSVQGLRVTHACEWETDFIPTFRTNHRHEQHEGEDDTSEPVV